MNNNEMKIDLTKCVDCKKSFIKGQEYWELKNKSTNEVAMNSCLNCWMSDWETTKKEWN